MRSAGAVTSYGSATATSGTTAGGHIDATNADNTIGGQTITIGSTVFQFQISGVPALAAGARAMNYTGGAWSTTIADAIRLWGLVGAGEEDNFIVDVSAIGVGAAGNLLMVSTTGLVVATGLSGGANPVLSGAAYPFGRFH